MLTAPSSSWGSPGLSCLPFHFLGRESCWKRVLHFVRPSVLPPTILGAAESSVPTELTRPGGVGASAFFSSSLWALTTSS